MCLSRRSSPLQPCGAMVRRTFLLLLALPVIGLAACSGDDARPRATLFDPEIPRAKPLDAPLPGAQATLTLATATPPRPAPEMRVAAGTAAAPPRVPGIVTDPNGVSLNFTDADVGAVLSSVLGDLLRLNYAIDPRVQGRITVQTATPLARESVLPALEAVLRGNGVALVRNGALVQAVPAEGARGGADGGAVRGPGWRTQVVPLRHANAENLQKAMEGLAPPGTSVRAEPQSNALVLTGSGGDLAALLDAVDVFDVDGMRGKSFGLFRLQRADARAVVDELDMIFHTDPRQAAAGTRFVPLERLNAVLAIARQPDALRQANEWVSRLDRPADSNDPQLHVYKVVSGRASHLADMLSKLYPEHSVDKVGRERTQTAEGGAGQGGGAGTQGTSPGSTRSADGGSFATPPGADPMAAGAAPARTAQPAAATAEAGARPADAAGTAPDERLATGPQRREQATSGVRIVADTASNALLILARPAVFAQIEQTLRRLDVVPAQVQIEATIAEVRLNDELRFGVQYFIESGNHGVRFTNQRTGTVAAGAPGFSYLFTGGNSRVVIDALKAVTDVNVLSTPTVMVLDNQTARLQVGDQVPIVTQQAQSVINADSPIVNQIQLKDTGVILAVTPRITAGGTVLMDVWQEVSDVVRTTTSNIDSPSFQRRRLESSVAVGNAETVALGGLIRQNRGRDHSGVPLLSEVPVLGALFGVRGDTVDRTELLVLITPRIVRTALDARAVTEELRQRLSDRPMIRPAVLP